MKDIVFGETIRRIRLEKGMTQEELAAGICSASNLSRIENGSQIPSRQTFHLLMERLGESGYSYVHLQGVADYHTQAICCELLEAFESGQTDKVDEQLWALHCLAEQKDSRLRQFYEMAKLIWFYLSGGIPKEDYLQHCHEIWRLNRDEEDVQTGLEKLQASEVELWVLNNLAIGYLWRGEAQQALQILFQVYGQVQKNGSRERRFWKTKAVLCSNIAVCLLHMQRPQEAKTYCTRAYQALQKEGGILLGVRLLRVKMEISLRLGEMEAYVAQRALLRQLYEVMGNGTYSLQEFEALLWQQKELLIFF